MGSPVGGGLVMHVHSIRLAERPDNWPTGDRRGDQSRWSIDFGRVFSGGAPRRRHERSRPTASSPPRRRRRGAAAARGATGSSTRPVRAAAIGTGAADQLDHGLDGPLLVVDGSAAARCCLALWWRRRWPLSSRWSRCRSRPSPRRRIRLLIVALFTVAAHRRWQPALSRRAPARGAADLPRRPDRRLGPRTGCTTSSASSPTPPSSLGHVRARAAGRRCASVRARRGRAGTADRAGPPRRAHPDRAGDARRARPPDLAAEPARRRAGVPARTRRRRRSPAPPAVIRDSAHQALEDLREVIGVLRDGPDGDAPRAAAADPGRPARAGRRVARAGHAGRARRPASPTWPPCPDAIGPQRATGSSRRG